MCHAGTGATALSGGAGGRDYLESLFIVDSMIVLHRPHLFSPRDSKMISPKTVSLVRVRGSGRCRHRTQQRPHLRTPMHLVAGRHVACCAPVARPSDRAAAARSRDARARAEMYAPSLPAARPRGRAWRVWCVRGRSCTGARHVASLGAEALEFTGHSALWRSSAPPRPSFEAPCSKLPYP